MITEWTHFYWIGPTNSEAKFVGYGGHEISASPNETLGWVACMDLCCNSQSYDDAEYVNNGDNYGWYAL